MKMRRDGHIVQVSPIAGRIAAPTSAAYSATKFGEIGFSEGLRAEVFRDNSRVTVIEPGIVDTELLDHVPSGRVRGALAERVKAMRPLQAIDIAENILFAVSRKAHVNINEMLIRPTDQEM